MASTFLGLDSPPDAFPSPRGPMRAGSCELIPLQRKPAGLCAGHRAAARSRTAACREWGAGPGGPSERMESDTPAMCGNGRVCGVLGAQRDGCSAGGATEGCTAVFVPRGACTRRAAPRCPPAPGDPRTFCLALHTARAALCPHLYGFLFPFPARFGAAVGRRSNRAPQPLCSRVRRGNWEIAPERHCLSSATSLCCLSLCHAGPHPAGKGARNAGCGGTRGGPAVPASGDKG